MIGRGVKLVRVTVRMHEGMWARVQRFTDEMKLPTVSVLVNTALAEYIDRLVAVRGEVAVTVAAPRELAAHRMRAERLHQAASSSRLEDAKTPAVEHPNLFHGGKRNRRPRRGAPGK